MQSNNLAALRLRQDGAFHMMLIALAVAGKVLWFEQCRVDHSYCRKLLHGCVQHYSCWSGDAYTDYILSNGRTYTLQNKHLTTRKQNFKIGNFLITNMQQLVWWVLKFDSVVNGNSWRVELSSDSCRCQFLTDAKIIGNHFSLDFLHQVYFTCTPFYRPRTLRYRDSSESDPPTNVVPRLEKHNCW